MPALLYEGSGFPLQSYHDKTEPIRCMPIAYIAAVAVAVAVAGIIEHRGATMEVMHQDNVAVEVVVNAAASFRESWRPSLLSPW